MARTRTTDKKGTRATGARNGAVNGVADEKLATGLVGLSVADFDTPTAGRLKSSGFAPGALLEMYRQMLLIRRFEEKTGEMYTRAKIGGYCHLNIGEEATIVGAMGALDRGDYVFTNYREHGYMLARDVEPKLVMAELFGKETGVSKGRGGSMHLFDIESRFMGGYAIVGGQLPLAAGAGLAISYQGLKDVVLCQMGDGTTNIGAFHESLNLAQLWKLPVVFLVVNNLYGMGTTVDKASAVAELYRKACAFDMRAERVNGNDVLATYAATKRAVDHAREHGLPTLLEAVSYRFRGHSVVDPARYRPQDEVNLWREHDPVLSFARALLDGGYIDEQGIAAIDDEISAIVDDAVVFADESPAPRPEELFTFDYATDVPNVDRRLPGQHTGAGVR